ncbi:hydantoinase/oxoprolinase family protein [Rhodobacter sp.]
MTAPTLRIAADVGGTFTDVAMIRGDKSIATRKVSSTPDDYSRGVVRGIVELLEVEGLSADEVGEVLHASTVATNTILEGKGAKTALLTTAGFRDILEMRRVRVPRLYDPLYRKPPALVPRRWRFEVEERMDHRGNVLTPLDETTVHRALDAVAAEGVEAIAVCLLHSYANPVHEQRIGEIIRQRFPGMFVSLSVDILPEIREYERTSTTAINSYIGPPVRGYLNALAERLHAAGLPRQFFMMHSAGGILDARTVMERPAQIVECGPAAGALGASKVMGRAGEGDAISFDMGGTTAKAALIENGRLVTTDDYEVGGGISLSSRLAKGGGYALKLPVIDISEVGAGGGSIVWIDRAGGLKVGPQSAGSVPGPACYGQGGDQPTVTDANVVLGYLNPQALAGGSVPIDAGLSRAVLTRDVAGPLGLDLDAAAFGVHELITNVMTRGVKSVTTYRGRDPREFTMIAFGGNGGVHSVSLARALGVRRVVVPPGSGVFSALGLLYADVETSASAAFLQPLETLTTGLLDPRFAELVARASHEIGRSTDELQIERRADFRYAGQAFELTLPFEESTALSAGDLTAVRDRFEDEHERLYGYRLARNAVELVTLRVTARLAGAGQVVSDYRPAQGGETRPDRMVYFGPAFGGRVATRVVDRAALAGGPEPGPLIVEEYDGTTVVPPDCRAALDALGNIVIDLPDPTQEARP